MWVNSSRTISLKDIYVVCDLWFVLIEPEKTAEKNRFFPPDVDEEIVIFRHFVSRSIHTPPYLIVHIIQAHLILTVKCNLYESSRIIECVCFKSCRLFWSWAYDAFVKTWKYTQTHSLTQYWIDGSSVFSHYFFFLFVLSFFSKNGVQRWQASQIMILLLFVKKAYHCFLFLSLSPNRFHRENPVFLATKIRV